MNNSAPAGSRSGFLTFAALLILLIAAFFIPNKVSAQPSPSPMQLKQDAITRLQEISTMDKHLQRTIKRAIRAMTGSLKDNTAQSIFTLQ